MSRTLLATQRILRTQQQQIRSFSATTRKMGVTVEVREAGSTSVAQIPFLLAKGAVH
jgi:hypothetical protein